MPTISFAQAIKPAAKITGSIVTTENKPVEFATVSLLRTKDSAIVKGALGNEAGVYALTNIANGNYIIKISAVGYNKGLSKPFTVSGNNVTVPAISMQSSAQALKTVNIQSARPLIERKLDRTVMNVENSVLAAGNSAMEILERAPGVSIDKDDNISLNGKSGVTVMINDKLTYLSSAQLATLLRSTDGTNIAAIELITNPSAKYDASGNSGIINIRLKKNREVGSSGSITTGVAYGHTWKDNQNLSLNHKDGKLNMFGTFSHNDNSNLQNLNIRRVVDSVGSLTYFNQYTPMQNTNHNNSYRVGADYDLTKHNTVGFIVNGYDNTRVDNLPTVTYIGKTLDVTNALLNSTSESHQHYKNFAANVNDRWQIDTLGQSLGIDLDYAKFSNTNNAAYATYSYKPNGQQSQAPVFLRNQSPSVIDIRTAKADYAYPFSKSLKLETGAKFSDVKTDNNLQAQRQNGAGVYVNDATRTNHFVYQEKIDAGYANLGKTWKKTSAQIGVRAEYTTSLATLAGTPPVPRNYIDFFPSFFVNHTLSKRNEIGFSYSRRIDRPSYDNLNPFVFYLDSLTYVQGNPFLKPQYTHAFELHYTWNNTINVNLNYSHTSDVITQIILTDAVKKATFQTNLNLDAQDAYGLNINSPYTINNWWSGNVNLNTFYLLNKANNLLGAKLNVGQLAYQFRTTQTFTFIKGYRLEILTNYKSDIKVGIYDVRPQYNIDGGISHSFANKKANIKFSVSDIFNTRTNNVNSMYQSVNLQITQKGETRVSRLTFTYNFGNNKIKARQHQTGADDESNRAGKG
ncbi:outer membrane beta-barrel family protein [Mucilaginibacter boryungensis]|uniref:TonB-dependent receptor family protein n=1 Tax=Mucilaginibacter boryungensis TaxID=768480 RepID=A0ABR9XMU1_9SPHI|nr:outer membrane beta-barrel family protein [Mucilaginibacter boryungensis]MBE9668699.1 TonB-dependent receptor family protein [Mucilaginibacter boryungensis]